MERSCCVNPKTKIILASGSPRRKEFLTRLGFAFTIIKPAIVEALNPGETATAYVERNATEKAQNVVAQWLADPAFKADEPFLVLAADTVVARDEHILEKPKDEDDARRMLYQLSGNMHQVLTGVCIAGRDVMGATVNRHFVVETEVEFKDLSAAEVDGYIRSGEPMDKAGAYAIQGLAAYMIRAIHGSYTNVVGLPLTEVMQIFEQDFDLYPFDT